MFGKPATHPLICPGPLEGMSVQPVVLRPGGQDMGDVLLTAGPRPPLQVAMSEGVVEQLSLIEPRGVGRRQPGTPPAPAVGNILVRLGGDAATTAIVNQEYPPEPAMLPSEGIQRRDVVLSV